MINRCDLTSTGCDIQLNSRLSIPMWIYDAQVSSGSRTTVCKNKGLAPADKRARHRPNPCCNL